MKIYAEEEAPFLAYCQNANSKVTNEMTALLFILANIIQGLRFASTAYASWATAALFHCGDRARERGR